MHAQTETPSLLIPDAPMLYINWPVRLLASESCTSSECVLDSSRSRWAAIGVVGVAFPIASGSVSAVLWYHSQTGPSSAIVFVLLAIGIWMTLSSAVAVYIQVIRRAIRRHEPFFVVNRSDYGTVIESAGRRISVDACHEDGLRIVSGAVHNPGSESPKALTQLQCLDTEGQWRVLLNSNQTPPLARIGRELLGGNLEPPTLRIPRRDWPTPQEMDGLLYTVFSAPVR